MKLDAIGKPPGQLGTARFLRTGYLPTYAAVVFLLILLWAGAPGQRVDFSRAWATAGKLGIAEILVLALVVILIAVLLQPLQLSLVRTLEVVGRAGSACVWPGGVSCDASGHSRRRLGAN